MEVYTAKKLVGQRIIVEGPDGEEMLRLNPKAYANADDAFALAEHLAKFMTQMRMWANLVKE